MLNSLNKLKEKNAGAGTFRLAVVLSQATKLMLCAAAANNFEPRYPFGNKLSLVNKSSRLTQYQVVPSRHQEPELIFCYLKNYAFFKFPEIKDFCDIHVIKEKK